MKLLRKLTIKNLLMNKSRTIVSIIGIALSVALITTVACIVSSMDASSVYTAMISSGDYDIYMMSDESLTKDDIAAIKTNRNVKDVYTLEFIKTYKLTDPKFQYVSNFNLYGTDQKTLNASCIEFESGRFAENENEIVISASLNRCSNKEYKLGDTLQAEYGKRVLKKGIPQFQYFYDLFGGYEIPEDFTGTFGDAEEWKKEGVKEFKIVGILKEEVGFLSSDNYSSSLFFTDTIKVYTYKEIENTNVLYVDLWENAESEYASVLAQLIGFDENDIRSIVDNSNFFIGDESEFGKRIEQSLKDSNSPYVSFGINRELLRAKGYLKDDSSGFTPSSFLVMFVGMLIVMLASVFIIRNSFEISITEKIRLYGMLSSVGTTPKQIRQNVFFEAFVLGVIGIPLGILTGIGITVALIAFASSVLSDQLGSYKLIFAVNFGAIALAIAVGIATILCSAATSAKKASKTSPMEAIRSSNDIKISAKQAKKGYAVPKWISKVFGVGGSIAWKNMKRSRKQYRATVISIIISVSLFLGINSVVDFKIRGLMSQDYYAIANSEYNVMIGVYAANESGEEEGIPAKTEEQYFEKITSDLGVSNYRFNYYSRDFEFSVTDDQICDEVKFGGLYYDRISSNTVKDGKVSYQFMAVDKKSFMKLCDEAGLKYEDCKDKGFIWNYNIMDIGEDNDRMPRPEPVKLFKDPVGMVLKGECVYEEEVYEDLPETSENDEADGYEDDYYQNVKTIEHKYNAEIEIAGTIEKVPASAGLSSIYNNRAIVVTTEKFEEFFTNPSYAEIDVSTSDPNGLEDRVSESIFQGSTPITNITNYSKLVNDMKSSLLVIQVFVYGFIAVISLIGVTNMFNTVTTNMKLRQKEFAMLRSIGTTSKELHMMILLESALYTFKSLMLGIPIGLIGGLLITWPMSNSLNSAGINDVYFRVPWIPMLMCILVVLLLLFAIMKFSIAKFNKQNIIETIRNDNI